MTQVAVELEGVTKIFPGPGGEKVVAVDRLDLKIPDGEFFSLLGPSGCGKTTTLRMIGGFEMPTGGQIYIGDEPQGYKPPFKRPVNTVFQHYALFPHMTVFENVAFGLQMQKIEQVEVEQRVIEALHMVQMTQMARRKPDQMSGGQQQRVALARALVNRPKVLLLDEPLGALDFKLRKAMQLELKALQEQVGITFVYVTHDQEEALTMSDRIGVMNKGKLLQVGTAQEIYEAPLSRFVSNFIGETNYLYGTVSQRSGEITTSGLTTSIYEIVIEPGHRIHASGRLGLHDGDRVTVAFRPEKMYITTDCDATQANCIDGQVADVVYKGASTTYIIDVGAGNRVKVDQQNIKAMFDTVYHPGEAVTITWPVDGCRAFFEEEALPDVEEDLV